MNNGNDLNIFRQDFMAKTLNVTADFDGRSLEFKFRALNTQDFFNLFQNYEQVVLFLLSETKIETTEDLTKTVFTKFPSAINLILASTVIHEENDLNIKAEFFRNNTDINFQLEALNAVFELTFKSGVAETIKKWNDQLSNILKIFFQAKEELMEH